MNLQGKYSSSKTVKKYTNKYQNIPTNSIIFVNEGSINNSSLYFTNFLERGIASSRNNQIKNIINSLIMHPNSFDNRFESRDISIQTEADVKKIERVKKILDLNVVKPNKNDTIYKSTLAERNERGFQLLFTMNEGTKTIYLIDLYHLTIPSKLDRKGNQFDLKEEYDRRKKYKKDIKDILF